MLGAQVLALCTYACKVFAAVECLNAHVQHCLRNSLTQKDVVQKCNGVFPLSDMMQATLLHCATIKQKHVCLQGMTALHLAAKGGRVTVAEYLLTQSMPLGMQNNQVCPWHRQDTSVVCLRDLGLI